MDACGSGVRWSGIGRIARPGFSVQFRVRITNANAVLSVEEKKQEVCLGTYMYIRELQSG